MTIKQHLDPVSSSLALSGYDVEEWEIEHINIAPMNNDDDNQTDRSAFYSFGMCDPDSF